MQLPIETPQLRLRLLTPADADFIRELVNEPAWLRFIGDRQIHTRPAAEAYIEKCLAMHRQHGVGLLAVELKGDAAPIGLCGLLQREHVSDLDLGFAFLERFRGRGFAREAAAATLRAGHEVLGHSRIVAFAHPENARSIALLQKLGFRFDSRLTLPGAASESCLFVWTAPVRA